MDVQAEKWRALSQARLDDKGKCRQQQMRQHLNHN